MPFQPKRKLETQVNFRDLKITKPETLNGIALNEGFGYRRHDDNTILFFEYDKKIVTYNITGNLHTHELNIVSNRWSEMGVEGISIIKND